MAYEAVATAEFNALLDEAVAFRIDNLGFVVPRGPSMPSTSSAIISLTIPYTGRLVDDGTDNAESLRWVRADSYIAVYRVHENCKRLALLNLLFATSNWRRRVLHQ